MSTGQLTLNDRFPWEEDDEVPAATPEPVAAATNTAAPESEAPANSGVVASAARSITATENGSELEDPAATSDVDAAFADLDSDADQGSASSASRPVAQKEYYSISEVCDLVGLKPHVLRYWETQFQVLNPSKNRSGNRVYQRKEIKLILLVKHLLYEEKYTVEGAKSKLDQIRRGRRLQSATTMTLDRQMIDLLRTELDQLHQILTLPGST
jgi:DNA-binding transcriptional MerR regulator